MSDNINNMDVKQLRNEVQLLRDELAIMRRKYEDILYNLDDENFSSRLVKQKGDMMTSITQTEESIKLQAEKVTENSQNIASLEVTANQITTEVKEQKTNISTLSSSISQTSNKISAVIRGDYTEDILSNYLTGIEITPNNIKMIATKESHSIFSGDGLRFYVLNKYGSPQKYQVEGWSIEPDANRGYGGVLNYYINAEEDSDNFEPCYTFGSGYSGLDYTETDLVLKATNSQRGKFVVDVSESGYREIVFVADDWSTDNKSPRVLANGQLLATQEWVNANAGSVAKFG